MENHTLISTCFWLPDCMKDDEIRLKGHCKLAKTKTTLFGLLL